MNHLTTTALKELVPEFLLTEAQAAKIIGVEPITMRMWRWRDRKRVPGSQPKSPPYVRVGVRGVRYPMDSLRGWIRALPVVEGVPQLPDNRRHPDIPTPAKEHAAVV